MAYGLVQSSSTIAGTTTNDNAPAGYVGQYLSASQAGGGPFGNGVWGDFVSLSLTAGDWDISYVFSFDKNGSNANTVRMGVSTTSGNNTTGLVLGDNLLQQVVSDAGATYASMTIANWRLSIASTTTVYAKGRFDYSVGSPVGYVRISARRIR
jgi:hypothetical protein